MEKLKTIQTKRAEIVKDIENRFNEYKKNIMIKTSATKLKMRLQLLTQRALKVDKIQAMCLEQVKEEIQNVEFYTKFCSDLIVEAVIKLHCADVFVQCLKRDYAVCKKACTQAEHDVTKLFAEHGLSSAKIHIELLKDYLDDEYDEPLEEVVGGVIVFTKDQIKRVDNTIKTRLDLIFNSFLCDLRNVLFED